MNAPASRFFGGLEPVRYAGPESRDPFTYRWYDADRMVAGRTMAEHLRFAACYWHSFCWPGGDPFGGETFLRPWMHGVDAMEMAEAKADVAFDLFRLLGVPFFTFHDVDAAPEGANLVEQRDNVAAICDVFEEKMAATGVKLLWGTANLFSHRRYMAGAATNPDPDIFAFAAATILSLRLLLAAGLARRSRVALDVAASGLVRSGLVERAVFTAGAATAILR